MTRHDTTRHDMTKHSTTRYDKAQHKLTNSVLITEPVRNDIEFG